jgi:RNA polymerase sigma-70 factor (ECF subfamily)
MLRVTRIGAGDGAETVRAEGRLTHETVEELRMACEAVLGTRSSLHLDVSGLQFVDATAVTVLRGLERRGARLGSCSPFIAELLRAHDEARAVPAPSAPTPHPIGHAPGLPVSDAALVETLRSGDPQSFEVLVREHGGRMLATARRLVGTDDEARDVVQEAFLAAFRAIHTFAGTARLSTWLHRIVINEALMKLRSRRRRREEPIDDLLPRFHEDGHWAEPVSPWNTSSDALLERRETQALVRKAIERLPGSYRKVLVLRDIEELDTEETASLLGVTPNAVKTRLHRARQALRTLLQRELAAARPDQDGARVSDRFG